MFFLILTPLIINRFLIEIHIVESPLFRVPYRSGSIATGQINAPFTIMLFVFMYLLLVLY